MTLLAACVVTAAAVVAVSVAWTLLDDWNRDHR